MRVILRTWAIVVIAIKRLFSQRGLAVATTVGLIAAVALVMSVPLYADAVYYRMLRAGLFDAPAGGTVSAQRPPFAFMYRYVGSWYKPVEWEKVAPLDQYLTTSSSGALGLPLKELVRHFKTDNFKLFPMDQVAYADIKEPLAWVAFGFVSDLQDHITILEGSFPPVADADPQSPMPVLISEARATELGLQVGERYMTFAPIPKGSSQAPQIPVEVAGIWKPTDPKEEFWFYEPSALEDLLLIPEESFHLRIDPTLQDEVYVALWYLVMDGSNVHAKDAGPLLGRIVAMQQHVSALLPNTALAISPVVPLQQYQKNSRLLTILLYAFSVPIIGLLLAFIVLVVGLAVGRRRNEIAVLRSRGATALQVVGIAALEGLLLGLVALVLATPVAEWITQAIGATTSFLTFATGGGLRVGMTSTTVRAGLAAVGLALLAQLIPTIGAARHTIVTYKQERARSLRPPWWQRAYLDVILLVPAVYGTYLLRKQGSIVLPAATGFSGSDPFQNPLLFLVPALAVFALTLLLLRVMPVLMAAFAWLAGHLGGVGTLLAARQLARTSSSYAAPLMLLVLTLSLSAFTASLAQTLDSHLYDQSYYKVGSDFQVVELGEDTQSTGGFGMGFGGGAPPSDTGTGDTAAAAPQGPRWNFLPISEYLKVPGVKAAARVGLYPATTRLSGGNQQGQFMGVDRVDFSRVAFWRRDFAPAQLGSLMNALALAPEGVLVNRAFMGQNALRVGDTVRIAVDTYGQRNELDMKIVGSFDLFPTWYPGDEEAGTLFVGNLEYLYEQAGDQYPYDVWLRTDPGLTTAALEAKLQELNLRVLDSDAALARVAKEQARPERQGLFGFLSIGFAAAALLTVLGFLLYALFSFQRRFIELGILRAIGLSASGMTSFLAWELAFLILTGLAAGTAFGVLISNLFIPPLQVGAGLEARTPPFLVEIAWPSIFRIWVLFALLFVIALAVLAGLLLRMRIFQAVKLGETA
jgi:putative ABC transport system permease protein